MRLFSLSLCGSYKGLKDQFFDFSYAQGNAFGLNGSGKSQLLELIGESSVLETDHQINNLSTDKKTKNNP